MPLSTALDRDCSCWEIGKGIMRCFVHLLAGLMLSSTNHNVANILRKRARAEVLDLLATAEF